MLYVLPVVLLISTDPLLLFPRGGAWQKPVLQPKRLTAWAVAIRHRASMPFFPPRATTAGSYFRVPFAFFFFSPTSLNSLHWLFWDSFNHFLGIFVCARARVVIMASPAIKKAITEAALTYTKPEGTVFEYGTAGVCALSLSFLFLVLPVEFLSAVTNCSVKLTSFPNCSFE